MIYENVKRLCTKHKTNIATVEKACGIANGTIGKWAGKDAAPRIDTVKAIADYFGVSVDSLLCCLISVPIPAIADSRL